MILFLDLDSESELLEEYYRTDFPGRDRYFLERANITPSPKDLENLRRKLPTRRPLDRIYGTTISLHQELLQRIQSTESSTESTTESTTESGTESSTESEDKNAASIFSSDLNILQAILAIVDLIMLSF